ncbi:hypothetical protein RB595_003947 [Gaeumannomyces hyphopodioides]
MSGPFARKALSPPALPANHNNGIYRSIRIRHPAYPNSASDLLLLSATDGDDWNGLDFDVARAACSIVTTVGWDKGVFAVQSEASSGALSAVERPADGILRESVYFWCRLSEGAIDPDVRTDKYPVYASFHHWRFPHSDLPEPWRSVALPENIHPTNSVPLAGKQAVVARDGSCRITAVIDACETAHVIPYSERNWFASNQMIQYVREPMAHLPIDDERNLILLRRDLHFLFDRNRYVFVPKRLPPLPSASSQSPSLAIAIHILQPKGSIQLVDTYHNCLTQPLRGLSPEMLFARFAWALFHEEIVTFFRADEAVVVRTWDKAAGCVKDDTLRANAVARIAQVFEPAGTRSRSGSPRKRALLSRDRESQDRDLCEESDLDWDEENGWDAEGDDKEEAADQRLRGRRRFRSSPTYSHQVSRNAGEPPSLVGSLVSTVFIASHGPAFVESAEDAHIPTRKRSRECYGQGSCGGRGKAARTKGPEDKILS